MMQEFALTVHTDHLTAGAETRVDREDVLLSQGCGQQQFAQVVGKYPDGLSVCRHLGFHTDLRFQGGPQ